ncbi:hypothetical protein Ade02nite_84420 [Paractinoplanes deccanensis]|uniref:Uncharacterized protein n=1 Tax=Paractinoplanes deccanensis TaxID=113561 RepID=A0ABQ3YIH2_9ACTN|nr:hypothetical protein Ade02nite_84420 [Actinoplanes deccanensis]
MAWAGPVKAAEATTAVSAAAGMRGTFTGRTSWGSGIGGPPFLVLCFDAVKTYINKLRKLRSPVIWANDGQT